jgi:hypothetical protein
MIITEATPHDGPRPDHVAMPIAIATVADYARVGHLAGDRCGREFARTYPPLTNADPRRFFSAVLTSIEAAVWTMRESGAAEPMTDAWRVAFMLALDPYTTAWRAVLSKEN